MWKDRRTLRDFILELIGMDALQPLFQPIYVLRFIVSIVDYRTQAARKAFFDLVIFRRECSTSILSDEKSNRTRNFYLLHSSQIISAIRRSDWFTIISA